MMQNLNLLSKCTACTPFCFTYTVPLRYFSSQLRAFWIAAELIPIFCFPRQFGRIRGSKLSGVPFKNILGGELVRLHSADWIFNICHETIPFKIRQNKMLRSKRQNCFSNVNCCRSIVFSEISDQSNSQAFPILPQVEQSSVYESGLVASRKCLLQFEWKVTDEPKAG